MFDPPSLRERYKHLVAWEGQWVNYWTITTGIPVRPNANPGDSGSAVGRENEKQKRVSKRVERENDAALLASGVLTAEDLRARSPTPGSSPSTRSSSPDSGSEAPLTPNMSTVSLSTSATSTTLISSFASDSSLPITASAAAAAAPSTTPRPQARRSKHHFITVPMGLSSSLGGHSRWLRVPIAGAEDEVVAHTGIFRA
jgi:hypothetical protein